MTYRWIVVALLVAMVAGCSKEPPPPKAVPVTPDRLPPKN
jgi:hypothetical protein